MAAAPKSSKNIGSVQVLQIFLRKEPDCSGASSLNPNCCKLADTSAADKPE